MGVDLAPLLKETDAHKIITFENLIGKHIAIDAFNTIYQFLAIIRQEGEPLKDLQGNVTSHLSGLFFRTINLIEEQIKPIFVFDGPPNPMKMAEIKRRKEIKEEASKKMAEAIDAGDDQEAVKFAQATSKLTGDMIDEGKNLLRAMGIPVIDAAQDGEAQTAYLVNKDLAWASASQDYDSLLFGANRIVRNISQNRTRKFGSTTVKVDLEWYSLPKVLEVLKLDRNQLVDVGILTGVDFFPGVEGCGAKTAIKLISEHGSIDQLIAKKIEIRKKPIDLDMDVINQVRQIFLNPMVNKEIPSIKWSAPDVPKIKEILCEKHNFGPDRVQGGIDRLIKKNAAKTQRTMDMFFAKK